MRGRTLKAHSRYFSRALLFGFLMSYGFFPVPDVVSAEDSAPAPLNVIGPISPPQPVAQPTAAVGIAKQDEMQELLADQKRQADEYAKMNAMNPMSRDFNAAALTGTQVDPRLAQFQSLLKNPFVQFSLKMAGNPEFTPSIQKLMEHPNRRNFLYSEVGLYLFFILFRAWRGSATSGFLARVWLNLWTLALCIMASSWILPKTFFGESYDKVANLVVASAKEQLQGIPSPASISLPSINPLSQSQTNQVGPASIAIPPVSSPVSSPVPAATLRPVALQPPKDPIQGIPPEELNRRLRELKKK